jgi:hypothetical protein
VPLTEPTLYAEEYGNFQIVLDSKGTAYSKIQADVVQHDSKLHMNAIVKTYLQVGLAGSIADVDVQDDAQDEEALFTRSR